MTLLCIFPCKMSLNWVGRWGVWGHLKFKAWLKRRLKDRSWISADPRVCAVHLSGSASFKYVAVNTYVSVCVLMNVLTHISGSASALTSLCLQAECFLYFHTCLCIFACLLVLLENMCVHVFRCCVARYRVQERVLLSVLQLLPHPPRS